MHCTIICKLVLETAFIGIITRIPDLDSVYRVTQIHHNMGIGKYRGIVDPARTFRIRGSAVLLNSVCYSKVGLGFRVNLSASTAKLSTPWKIKAKSTQDAAVKQLMF